MTALRLLLLVLVFAPASGFAQQEEEEEEERQTASRRPVWRATLSGGEFAVDLRRVTSVSFHSYILDGMGKVTEVTAATDGSLIGRFYFIEPNVPEAPGGVGQSAVSIIQDRGGQALDRAGAEEIQTAVIKNYPETTHAHTVEYRLSSAEEAQELFESLDRSWRSLSSGKFEP